MSTTYTPEQRNKNRRNIALTAGALLAVIAVSGLVQGWPVGSFVAAVVVVVAIGLIFWWLFAARSAHPLPQGKKHARVFWMLSKQKEAELANRRDRGGGGR